MLERLRRHPLLTFLTLFLGAAGVALALFLYFFDLNDYRSQLQARLQGALQRPVQIGSIHFTLRHGLSLDLTATTIGAPEDAASLVVDHLLLRLRLAPLWQQQLSFSSILLEGAKFRIVVPDGEEETAPAEVVPERMKTLIDLLQRTNITTLVLRNGSATIMAGSRRYDLDKIDLQLHNIAFRAPITVAAAGELRVGALRAPWQLAGNMEVASAEAPWQEIRTNLTLGVQGIDLAQLPQALGREAKNYRLQGVADLDVGTQGAPATGLSFTVWAAGQDLSLELPAHYQAPLRVEQALLSGIWQSGDPGTLRELLLRLDTFSLLGEAVLPTAAGAPLVATLSLADAPLARLGQLIPDRTLPRLATVLRAPGVNGSAGLKKIELRWAAATGLHLASVHGHLRGARFALKEIGLVEGVEGDGEWTEGALRINSAQATLLGGRSEGAGNILFPRQGEPIFNLKVTGTALAEALTPLVPAVWQEKLQAKGPLSFSGNVGGTPSRLLLDLQSRFDAAAVRFNNIPLKAAGEVGELLILGAMGSSRLELSHARLLLPFGEARANGRLALADNGDYSLACNISNLFLEKLPPFLPVQEKLQGRGAVDLSLDFSGDQSGLKSLQGSGEFRELGLHLWGGVADLRGGRGRMLLSREGIDFPAISGFLGLSPINASAALTWLPEFKLALDLDLARTRAADLVFNSPQKTFDSIRGRLLISRKEILFEKISTRIADETAALINGRLTYAPLSLVLDIDADRADVAGIIALWQGGKKDAASAPPPSPAPRPLSIDITTKVASGDLYGVTFQKASGKIALRNGKLLIQPLWLEIGAGRAIVAVAVGPLHAQHPLLTISGKTEKIDAARVQKQLLGRQGSITGTLASTFYLQGEIGRFLPTCSGNVNLHLKQGLLRGFTSISRALALFNVGKILTFNMPDVAREGLLYERIQGNLTFADGVAKSEDLAVNSPAFDMAFIGKADLAQDHLDFIIGVKPLQTVDKVLSNIPLAGWILTGEKKAFVVANFHITGSSQDPKVEAIPFSSLSDMAVGIYKRTFGLPGKIVNDVTELFK